MLPRLFATHHRTLLIAAAALLLPGCLVNASRHQIVRRDEPRTVVEFESSLAAEAFKSKALDASVREVYADQRFFAIPLLFSYNAKRVLSENAWYNDQIAICDSDGDGVISEDEALTYNQAFELASSNWFRRQLPPEEDVIRYASGYEPPEVFGQPNPEPARTSPRFSELVD